MTHLTSQTDKEWQAQWQAMEALRHERRAHEDSLVGWQETTPAGDPVPPRSSMTQVREENLHEDVGEVKRIWRGRPKLEQEKPVEDDGDEIPM